MLILDPRERFFAGLQSLGSHLVGKKGASIPCVVIRKCKSISLMSFKNQMIVHVSAALAVMLIISMPVQTNAEELYTWAKSFGGANNENVFRAVTRSDDGGYLIAGDTTSFGAGSTDVWAIKLNEGGGIEWQKTYGGTGSDTTRAVARTSDGGYVIASRSSSFGSGGSNFWVLKISSIGGIDWQKTVGGSRSEIPHAIQQTADGGYIVGGFTNSFGALGKDYYVVKLDANGIAQWQNRYGGNGGDVIRSILQVSDGGYLVAGFTHSFGTAGDIMILKLDESGELEWQKRYGGAKFEEPSTILEVSDGFIVMEQSSSFTGSTDAWIFKIDFDGDMIWQRTFGGRGGMDELSSAMLTDDGGFIAAGETSSNFIPSEDFWAVKFDADGFPEWQKRYGGMNIDSVESMDLTPEGGAIMVGTTRSFGAGGLDIWGVRVNADGTLLGNCIDEIEVHDTEARLRTTNAVPADVDVTFAETDGTIRDTNAIVKNTDAIVEVQCNATEIAT